MVAGVIDAWVGGGGGDRENCHRNCHRTGWHKVVPNGFSGTKNEIKSSETGLVGMACAPLVRLKKPPRQRQ